MLSAASIARNVTDLMFRSVGINKVSATNILTVPIQLYSLVVVK